MPKTYMHVAHMSRCKDERLDPFGALAQVQVENETEPWYNVKKFVNRMRKHKMAELEKIYRRNDNFVFRRIEGETILVPIRDNVGDLDCIYSLNAVGALVWEHLDGSHDLDAIKNRIAAEYDVSDNDVQADLLSFIHEMKTIAAVEAVRR